MKLVKHTFVRDSRDILTWEISSWYATLLKTASFCRFSIFNTREPKIAITTTNPLAYDTVRAHLHQVSLSMLQQLCDYASSTIPIENNGIAQKWVATPFHCFQWEQYLQCHGSVDADAWCKQALTQRNLRLGWPTWLPSPVEHMDVHQVLEVRAQFAPVASVPFVGEADGLVLPVGPVHPVIVQGEAERMRQVLLYQRLQVKRMEINFKWDTENFFFNFGRHQSFCGATGAPVLDVWWCLPWVSKPEWILYFCASSPTCNWFFTFTFSVTPADLLMASMVAKPFDLHTSHRYTCIAGTWTWNRVCNTVCADMLPNEPYRLCRTRRSYIFDISSITRDSGRLHWSIFLLNR